MKQDLKTKLLHRKIKKPNPLLMAIGFCVVGIMNKVYRVKFSYDYDRKMLRKQPTILLSSHASRLEFIYSIYGFRHKDINVVCGYQNILQKGLYPLFLKFGVISKYLYQPDFLCVKNMFRVLRRNGTIGLFPEGIQSTSGSLHPINPATTSFIKRSHSNIVVCTSKGAYMATNRYSGDRKKGPISMEYSLLFTPKMLEELSEEQIYTMLLEKIRYNDFAYNKVARNKYVGKKPNAFGLDKILYKCPACKGEHVLSVENDTVVCSACGFSATVNEYYDLLDKAGKTYDFDIDTWYKWQRSCMAKQVQDESFTLALDASLYTIKTDKLRKSPHDRELLSVGRVTLTRRGLVFSGTLDGKAADFEFPAKSLYSLTYSTKNFFEFYYNNEYYMIFPDHAKTGLIQWTLASEEIHNLYDDKWKAACQDVYDYGRSDIYE